MRISALMVSESPYRKLGINREHFEPITESKLQIGVKS
jgi:hypothetical protein